LNQEHNNRQLGVTAALAAFITWGLAPIYFKWIVVVPPLEIIAHRICWSIPILAGFLLFRDGPSFLQRMLLKPRQLAILCVTAVLIGSNWLIFVWAINNDQILATSLGYFINPLVNIVLGIVFLQERLTRVQTLAVLIAAFGTAYLTWFLGVTPWISLTLALSFGLYGLVRKKLGIGPMIGMLWESLLLLTPAIIFLFWSSFHGGLVFGNTTLRLNSLLALTGLVTVLPLVWFNVAARHLDLSTVGFFQYIAPTITFVLAVFIYGEEFTRGHAVAFGCIWFSLVLISTESIIRSQRKSRPLS
jgi:chloramphenicol-sensitive protein RarD